MRQKTKRDKKVLLRERKRHTASHAASVCCADLSWLGWGGGLPTLASGVPTLTRDTYLGCRVPTLARGVPTWPGGVPTLVGGTYPGWWYPSWGTPIWTWLEYSPPGCEQTPVKTVPSPILLMRVVIMCTVHRFESHAVMQVMT